MRLHRPQSRRSRDRRRSADTSPGAADWKIPDSIYFERELPLGPTGKVQRRLLAEILR
jgi:non-ribosomal peptide synthetase component E (peptide arylation enzyme)